MIRLVRLLLSALALPALAGGCITASTALADTTQIEPAQTLVLQLKWAHQFQFAGYYAAVEKGFYAEEGLNVRIAPAIPGQDPIHSVLDGEATYGIGASDLVLLRGQGHPVVALAAIYQHSPLVLLASRSSGIESVHDLVGKRVMIEQQSASILAYLRDEHIPMDMLDIRHHRFSPTALIEGEVDAISAYTTDEAFVLEQAGVDYRVLSPRASGIDFYGDTLFTTATEVDEHPQRVDAFVRASLRGWRYALANPEEIIDVIWSRYSQRHSRAHLAYEARHSEALISADIVELGYMNPGRWRYIAEVYGSLGLMPENVDLDGFLWRPGTDTGSNLRGLYAPLAGAALLGVLITYAALRFYRTSRRLGQEIIRREVIQKDLADANERYRLLVDAAPFPVVISELATGAIRFLNPLAADKLAISPSDIGLSSRAFYVHPDDRLRFLEALGKGSRVDGFDIELRAANGNVFWASVSASCIDYGDTRAIFSAFTDITERKHIEQRLRELADNDPLTGIANRRRFLELLTEALDRSLHQHQPMTLLALDVDHFKRINDTHGHAAGDDVLRALVATIKRHLRHHDILGRTGGDGLSLYLPDTSLELGLGFAECVRQAVAALAIDIDDARAAVTVSIGVTETGPDDDLQRLMARVDNALHSAKREGRNRVIAETAGGR